MKRRAPIRKNVWPFSSTKEKHWSEQEGGFKRAMAAKKQEAALERRQKKEWALAQHREEMERIRAATREAAIERARAKYEKMMAAKKARTERATEVRTATKAKAAVKSAEQKGYDYIPSEAAIQDAYRRGATNLSEALQMAGARKNPAKFDRCVKAVQKRGVAANAYAVCTAAGTRKRKKNPADEAIAGYEDFHGRPPEEFVEVSRRVHFHSNLSGAGELKRLVVLTVDGKAVVTLKRFGGAILAFNERRNQLFIEGGDQAINLEDFGIDSPHELETLGRVKKIDYFTTKDHLGKDGGTATYQHTFRTTNEDGRHVTIRIARYPDLIYRVLEKHLEFSGGSYTILPEGIDR